MFLGSHFPDCVWNAELFLDLPWGYATINPQQMENIVKLKMHFNAFHQLNIIA